MLLAVCWATVVIRPHAALVRDSQDPQIDATRRQVAGTVVRLADEARAEPLGTLVAATNFIEKSPTLRDSIDQLNTTGTIDVSHLDPQTTQKLNDLTKQISKGQYTSIQQLLDAAQRSDPVRQEPHRRTSSASAHRK